MKLLTRLFLLLFCLSPILTFANVYVQGYVKYPNGTPAAGVTVNIQSDSTVIQSNCQFTHYRTTNSAGFYVDTLFCSGNITTVKTWVFNPCTGGVIIHDQAPTSNYIVESNFTICDSVPNACVATFTRRDSTNMIIFNSGYSHGVNPTDTIISRTWTFGDGTSLGGNIINAAHNYYMPGNYSVCLKIKTQLGCEKTVCNNISVTSSSTCNARVYVNYFPSVSPLKVSLNSGISTTAPGDSIISRTWTFGDGDSLNGNVVMPQHTYPAYGTYIACLTIKTRLGCESRSCFGVIVEDPTRSCYADIYYTDPVTSNSGYTVRFHGSRSQASYNDTIVQYKWSFGDGTIGYDSVNNHTYNTSGYYNVCLMITSGSGCRDTICQTVRVHCEALFTIDSVGVPVGGNLNYRYYRFNSIVSHGVTASDSIVSRTWNFGQTTVPNNTIAPVIGYPTPGTYTACLSIVTASGCRDSLCKTIVVPAPPVVCRPSFTKESNGLLATFNSSASILSTGDSIISRSWTFGDGTSAGNTVIANHQYAEPGIYNVCLTVRSRLGCVTTFCQQIAVTPVSGNCIPYYSWERVAAPKTIRFNSTAAYAQLPGDSIIERKWEFGDGQVLTGNVVVPQHTYLHGGTYNVCLRIKTAQNCERTWCRTIQVTPFDSTNTNDSIRIVNLYPIPVTTQLNAVIYSSHPNVNAVLSIHDVYGVVKWSQSVVLPYNNSTYNIPTSQLSNGPYIFKVTSTYSTLSRTFYKLN